MGRVTREDGGSRETRYDLILPETRRVKEMIRKRCHVNLEIDNPHIRSLFCVLALFLFSPNRPSGPHSRLSRGRRKVEFVEKKVSKDK